MPGVLVAARKAGGVFARRREEPNPNAVAGPRVDLDEPLAGSTFKEPTRHKRSRLSAVTNYEIHKPGNQRLFPAGTERMALPNAGGLPPTAIAGGVSGRRFSYAMTASRMQHFWL
jgi:hypothetical protein